MSNEISKYEEDILAYADLCSEYGISFNDDDAEDYAESVARRIMRDDEPEILARINQFKHQHKLR